MALDYFLQGCLSIMGKNSVSKQETGGNHAGFFISLYLLVLSLFLMILDYFDFLHIDSSFSITLLSAASSLSFCYFAYYSYTRGDFREQSSYYPLIFLLLLVLLVVNRFLSFGFIDTYSSSFYFLMIFFGLLTLALSLYDRELRTLSAARSKEGKRKKSEGSSDGEKSLSFFERVRSEKFFYFVLFHIVLIAFLLRLYQLGKLGITFDEGIVYMVTEMILEKGIPQFPTGFLYLRGLPYTYVTAFFSLIFGLSEFTLRLVSVLSFMAALVYIIRIFRLFRVDSVLILSAATFLSFHYWTLSLSRWGRMYMFAIALSLIALFYFLRYVREKKTGDLFWYVLFAALAFGSHNSGLIVLLFIPAYLLVTYAHYLKGSFSKFFQKDLYVREYKILLAFVVLSLLRYGFSFLAQFGQGVVSLDGDADEVSFFQSLTTSFHLTLHLNDAVLQVLQSYFFYFFPFLILGVFLLFRRDFETEKKVVLLSTLLVLVASFFNDDPYFVGGRIIFFQFFFLLLSVVFVFDAFRPFLKRVFSFYLLVLLLLYQGFSFPLLSYGDSVETEFSPSHVVSFYPDNKNPTVELSKIIRSDDIVLFYGYPVRSYPYLDGISPDQIYAVAKGDSTEKMDPYLGNHKVYSEDEIRSLIEANRDKNIYIVSTFSVLSGKEKYLNHFKASYYTRILDLYKPELLYTGEDGVSKLYLIPQSK